MLRSIYFFYDVPFSPLPVFIFLYYPSVTAVMGTSNAICHIDQLCVHEAVDATQMSDFKTTPRTLSSQCPCHIDAAIDQ